MSIGSAIKRLRLEKKLTQEQLAECLGISSRAVSQWECERTSPDISQIPVLCNVLETSADILLEINIEKNDEKINALLLQANEAIKNAEREKRTDILRQAMRQFPRSFKIMEQLADALVSEYSRKGIKNYNEVFELCERILSECTDSMIRRRALSTLCTAYDCAGMKEQMLSTADKMVPFEFCRESFLLWHMNGDKGLAERQAYLSDLLCELTTTLYLIAGQCHDGGGYILSKDERVEILKQQVSVIELLYPDGDYCLAAQAAAISSRWLAATYLGVGDTEKAVHWLEKYCNFAINFDTYDFNGTHTSPAFKGYRADGWIMENDGNQSAQMLEWLQNSSDTECIRNDKHIKIITERLKAVAQKP